MYNSFRLVTNNTFVLTRSSSSIRVESAGGRIPPPTRGSADLPYTDGGQAQDYFTIKVCSVGKSDRRRDVTQGNPLRPSEWGFKIGYLPNIYVDFCTFSCFSLDTEDQIFQ